MLYTWHKADGLTATGIAELALVQVAVGGKQVGLTKKNGTVLAFSTNCPHAGANLCEGWLDAQGRVVCPLHKYRFDPANGRNTSGEGYKLFTYPVEIRDNNIYIGLIKQKR